MGHKAQQFCDSISQIQFRNKELTMQNGSLFGKLFDFSFKEFITLQIVKYLYILGMVFVGHYRTGTTRGRICVYAVQLLERAWRRADGTYSLFPAGAPYEAASGSACGNIPYCGEHQHTGRAERKTLSSSLRSLKL